MAFLCARFRRDAWAWLWLESLLATACWRVRSRDRVLEPSKVYFETVQSPPGVPEAFRNASNTFEGRRGV